MLHYMSYLLKSKWPLALLFLIVFFVGGPLQILTITRIEQSLQLSSIFFLGLAFVVALGLILPIYNFRHVYEKKSLDFYFSIPISKSSQFNSTVLITNLLVSIPLLLCGTLLILLVDPTHQWGVFISTLSLLFSFTVIQAIATYISLQNYRFHDSFITLVAWFGLPLFLYLILQSYFSGAILGYATTFQSLGWLNPIVISSDWISLQFSTNYISQITVMMPILWVSLASLLMYRSYVSYVHFPSEQAQDVNEKWNYYPLLMNVYMVAFLLLSYSSYNRAYLTDSLQSDSYVLFNLIVPMLAIYVFYIFISFIAKRSTKSFLRSTLAFILALAVSFGFNYTLLSTKGFGYTNYIPNASDVESIKISSIYPNYIDFAQRWPFIPYVIEEEASIEAVIDYHEAILSTLGQPEKYFSQYGTYDVEYTMKNGSTVVRSFTISDLTSVDYSILENFYSSTEVYANLYSYLLEDTVYYSTYNILYYDQFTTKTNTMDSEFIAILNEELQNVHFEPLYQGSNVVTYLGMNKDKVVQKDQYGNSMMSDQVIPITKSMVKTIAYLEAHGQLTKILSLDEQVDNIAKMEYVILAENDNGNSKILNPSIIQQYSIPFGKEGITRTAYTIHEDAYDAIAPYAYDFLGSKDASLGVLIVTFKNQNFGYYAIDTSHVLAAMYKGK